MNRLLPLLALAALAACSGPTTTRLSGAETRSATDAPRIVPAGFTGERDGTRVDLVTGEGLVLSGLLREEQRPVTARITTTERPLVGGETLLVGQVSGTGLSLDCRFLLLNPVRGVDGGGAGLCSGSERRIEFLF
jgi:hypothetical protein